MNSWPTFSEAYQYILRDVLFRPQFTCSPRGQRIKEILGYTFTVTCPDNGKPIRTANPDRNKVIETYTSAEFELYASLTRDAEEFARAASFWRKLKNPDGTINSAYGYLIWGRKCCGNLGFESGGQMRTPWDWMIQTLIHDKDSRQAILHFNTPDVLWFGNKDVTCTMSAQFFIREDKLIMDVNMRSQDIVRGWPYDIAWFSHLLFRAVEDLKSTYPNLTVGTYSHKSGSMHVYETQWEMAQKMLGPLS
jgi:thymidylate synthase